MGDVHIAAGNDRLCFIKRTEIPAEAILPVHAVIKALQLAAGVGSIDVHKVKIGIFKGDNPPFAVVAFNINAVKDGKGFVLCKNRRAGIAFLFGAVPILIISGKVEFNLVRLKLCFLKAEKIRVQLAEAIHKALAHTGAKTVYVP